MSVDSTEKGVILIVDDTPTNLEVLLDFLEDSGFKVWVAEDGESAIEGAEYAPPELILLDVLMPGIDGFETCRRLKANPATQDIPVIFMTALTHTVDKVRGLSLGAVDYITKPLQHEEVLARINLHLSLRNLTKTLKEQNLRLEQEIQERKRSEQEREQAFKALQESEARFRRLVESNMIGIILADLSGNITEANDAFLELVGYEREDLHSGNLRWDEMTPPEYGHLEEKAIAEIISSGVCTPFPKEYIRKDGTRVPVMVGAALIEESQQTVVGFVLDITERQQAELKIREQAALLDITTDAMLVRDLKGQIRFWNKAAERLYGWNSQDAIGKSANELLYRQESLSQLQEIQTSLAECGEWQGELHQVTRQGKDIIVASRWTVVRDEEGQPKSVLTVNTDITEKKQLETQFLRAQRMESIGTLASGIAHDLNNVLSPILMIAQLLETQYQDKRSKKLLPILVQNAKRGANLVKQVLSFGRGLEGQYTILQVKHLISDIQQIATQTFPKSIEFYTDIQQNLCAVFGDATQLHQVFMNLCVNARDAMPKGGILRICAGNIFIDENQAQINLDAQVGSYILISISDTGTGIPPEILDRIFEPFFTTKEIGKGTGLGLSTVISIIKGHGGFINVYSEIGKGTKFKVYLPAVKNDEIQQVEDIELPTGNGELILAVDDEASIREITKMLLEEYGYRVLTASNGIDAVALYTQHKDEISVVLLDMMMPSMDGPSTIRQLQKINPLVKIIATSGLAFNVMVAEAANFGVKTFLSKPFTREELLETISGPLRRESVT